MFDLDSTGGRMSKNDEHPSTSQAADSENESKSNDLNQCSVRGEPGCRRGGRRPGAGRKPIQIDLQMIKQLYSIGCKNIDIAGFCGCSVRTIEVRSKKGAFAKAKNHGRASARINVLRMLFKAAQEGSVPALIYLIKYLEPNLDGAGADSAIVLHISKDDARL